MSEQKKCVHTGCACDASEGSDHCSNYCKVVAAKDQNGNGCVCGHSPCDSPHASVPR